MTSDEKNVLQPVAQTNLRLYRQLHDAGYTNAQLLWVRDSYELATALFAGQLRGSGKPFVAHLVGTASILASVDAPPVAVVAGLLHAAYEQGDFGLARWRHRRERVRTVIGEPAESLAWRYLEMPWAPSEIDRLRAGAARLNETDRLVVLMRLANELDDNLDLAMLHCHAEKDAFRDCRDGLVALAHSFGAPVLANALLATYREASDGSWAIGMSLDRPASYQLASPFGLRLLQPLKKLASLAQALAKATGL